MAHGLVLAGPVGTPRRIDRTLFAVVMEAPVHGVSTRKVDELVQALGVGTASSSTPSMSKAASAAGVVSRAVVIATGASATGDREVLGIDIEDSEDGRSGSRSAKACAPAA